MAYKTERALLALSRKCLLTPVLHHKGPRVPGEEQDRSFLKATEKDQGRHGGVGQGDQSAVTQAEGGFAPSRQDRPMAWASGWKVLV